MISNYLKTYSNYYLSRYTVTKKKFEEILKKKLKIIKHLKKKLKIKT